MIDLKVTQFQADMLAKSRSQLDRDMAADRAKLMEEVERLEGRHLSHISERDRARENEQAAIAAKDAAEKRLGELQRRVRVPDGAVRADAWTHGGHLIVCGDPPESNGDCDDPTQHNCDAMGCSSVSHVIIRERLDERGGIARVAELDAALARVRELEGATAPPKPAVKLPCGDFCAPDVTDEQIEATMAAIYLAPDRTFDLATADFKRWESFRDYEHTPARVTSAVFAMLRQSDRDSKTVVPELYDRRGLAIITVKWPLPNLQVCSAPPAPI